ncbi:MAG: DUF1343 domain-containing protein [Bacteroidota bacterium]|nr:DUF1343 domain-containing protein [Bacteroidota bacterium]
MKKLYSLLVITLFSFCATIVSAHNVKTGIEVLRENNFNILKGKRVGLITNPTGIDRNIKSTIDILFEAPGVKLVALYGPEHGVRGDTPAGEYVESAKDSRTGLPVYSLYGKTRKPTPEMLKGIDVLVYDIQDIGSRSYTYISTMGLAMEAAAENNLEFVVLDRPNPLGGLKMEGPLTEPGFTSFVSQFPIPYVHGLTVGELASYLNNEKLLTNGEQCKLTVVKMKGWKRKMTFTDTNLPWVPSSPHIPYAQSASFYPVSGILGELYVFNIGVGYTLPFQLFGAEWIDDAEKLAFELNNLHVPGCVFRPIHFKPYYSVSKDKMVHGVQVHITDYGKVPLSLVQFYILQECHKIYPSKNVFDLCAPDRISMFDKVSGTDQVRKLFSKNFLVSDIVSLWNKDVELFRAKTKRSLLYK